MVIVSDHLSHDKYAAYTFFTLALEKLEGKLKKSFKSVVVYSDGVASQFKQRYLLCSLTHLKRDLEWSCGWDWG